MATNKKAISAYLPTDLEEYLTNYCTEYNITRKDKSGEIKPALGTAVVEILKIFFSSDELPSPLPDNVPLLPSNVVTEDRLEFVLSKLEVFSNVSSIIPSNVLTKDELDKALSNVDVRVNTAIGEAIPKAIAELKSDEEFLKAIAAKAVTVESGVDSIIQKAISTIATDNENYPSTDETESYENRQTTTQIDKATPAPIFEELEESKPVKLLSKKKAFELAKQRGYKSSDAAFAQWFRDHRGGNLYGISKHSDRGKYEDTV